MKEVSSIASGIGSFKRSELVTMPRADAGSIGVSGSLALSSGDATNGDTITTIDLEIG